MRFIIATKNPKKLAELQRILAPIGIEAISEKELTTPLPEVEETGSTFAENARLKALSAMRHTGMPAIADDSGLLVDVLNGEPGVYSSRYAGEQATDDENIIKLLQAMQNVPAEMRKARFQTVICCILPDGREISVTGSCEGWIGKEKVGSGGFGYDPVFMTEQGSFAELSPAAKDKISHRGQALLALRDVMPSFLNSYHQ